MAGPINSFHTVGYKNEITQVGLRVTPLKSRDFVYLPEQSVSLFDIFEIM